MNLKKLFNPTNPITKTITTKQKISYEYERMINDIHFQDCQKRNKTNQLDYTICKDRSNKIDNDDDYCGCSCKNQNSY